MHTRLRRRWTMLLSAMASALAPSTHGRRVLVTVAAATLAAGAVVAPAPASAAANPNPARITDASWWLMEELLKLQPGSLNGGIYANKSGYHNTRAGNASNDYSVRDAEDQGGPSDKAAAYDWTFPEAQSRALLSLEVDPDAHQRLPSTVTAATSNYTNIARFSNRLLASGRDPDDPRLNGWREFFGQTDNDNTVEGWDFRYRQSSSSDASHLWHIHLSEDRDKVESFENKEALLSVLRGETVAEWSLGAQSGAGPTAIQFGTALNLYNISRRTGIVYQRAYVPDSGWTEWLNLGGNMSGRVTAVNYRGALNVYAVNRTNGNMYQKAYSNGAWLPWENLGGEFRGSPAVIQWGEALNVYGVSKDNGYLYQKSYVPGSSWTGWNRIGDGVFDGSPTAAIHDGELQVGALSPSGRLYLNSYVNGGGWQGWHQPTEGQFQVGSTPVIISNGVSLNLYAVGQGAGRMWENVLTTGWSGWRIVTTGMFAGSAAATKTADGALNLFAMSPGERVYTNRHGGTWSGWSDLGGAMVGRPATIEFGGDLHLFATSGNSGVTYTRVRTSAGWQGWVALP